MEQRKLYKTIENFSKQAPNFETTEEFLCYVMNQIINYENIDIIGGRLWKLSDDKKYYKLVEQMGDVQKIDPGYKLKVEKNPYFFLIGKRRSIMASETDFYLKKKGIRLYSATGVGERYKIKKDNEILFLFKYLIAFNGKKIDEELLNTLNIVSTTLSYILRAKKIESSIKENIVELEKASDIQKSILPEHALEFGNYEIFGISVPEKIVGGDFFDYIISGDNDKLSVVVADAASKGISAAAQALYVSGALKMGAEYNVSAASLIKKVNELVHSTFPNERFVTMFYCEIFNDSKGLCLCVNAGHNSPYKYSNTNNSIEELLPTGPVLGPSPNQNYYTDSFYIEKNDILLLYTDGIIEAANKNFEFYGESRLKNILLQNVQLSPKEICEKIIEDVQIFSAMGKYADDKTIVIIKRNK